MMDAKFKEQLKHVVDDSKSFSDPTLIALLSAAVDRFGQLQENPDAPPPLQPTDVVKNLQDVGNAMVKQLQDLGLSKEKRTEIRQILAAEGLSSAACW